MFFPVNGDPYYSNVSLLLPMTGANNSTTFTDYSPSPKTITRGGDTKISTAQSKWGNGSGYFDGTGDYLSTPYSSAFDFGSGDGTVEAWVYIAGNSVADIDGSRSFVITSTWTNTISGWSLLVLGNTTTTGTGLSFDSWSAPAGTQYRATVSVSKNAWHHTAASVQSGTRRLFLDGALISGSTITISGGYTQINAFNALNIGKTVSSNYPLPLNGYILDLRITKGVARYTANFTPPIVPLSPRLPEMPVRSAIIQPSFRQIARLGL